MDATGPRHLVPFETFHLPHHLTDVLVLGAGVAGLSAALAARGQGRRVIVIAKGAIEESNTGYAQGGVAAVLDDEGDSPDLHARDTIEVGQGLCDEALVRHVTEDAAEAVDRLRALGAHFDTADEGGAARGLEGGHSAPRILHARGDATGAEIRDVLAAAAFGGEGVERWEETFLVDLLTDAQDRCVGALVLRRGHLRAIWARAVVMATGGYAQLYRESTNVPGATGDGIAAAWRAGAEVTDMEFVQFHPTTLYLAGVPRLLITEALRGEGAHIVDDQGRRFLAEELEQAELAPRDLVSQAIIRHLQRPDVGGVYLDLSHLDADRIVRRFPGVAASCRAHGLDLGRDRIPIRPAAHYTIGGVRVDGDGRTRVPGLLAVGEVAASGLHGANRLASNSLLEGLVLGERAGRAAADDAGEEEPAPVAIRGQGTGAGPGFMDEDDLRTSLKALMWRAVGIERHGGGLTGALGAQDAWEGFALRIGPNSKERLTLLNMLLVARLVTRGALLREESRGTHRRRDFPDRDDALWRVRLVHRRGEEPRRVPLAVSGNGASAPAPSVGTEA